MVKNRRHKMIREIINNHDVETQFQLMDELHKYGFNVTQATISRDIKELGLIKVTSGDSTLHYAFPQGVVSGNNFERAKRMMRDNLLKIDVSVNLVVIKTLPGTAQGVAFCIDTLSLKEILGSVAGDDTIMLIIREECSPRDVMEKLQALAQ
ncbi:MAG: arginine repressor [Clostridia bacterium]|nr:arginine repressor [Clostridia bacterium]